MSKSEFHSAVTKITGDTFVLGDDSEPERLVEELLELKEDLPGPLVVCVGGGAGNRGRDGSKYGLDRLKADEDGMVASVLNASILVEAFGNKALGFTGIPTYVLTKHMEAETDRARRAALGVAKVNLHHETELRALQKTSDPKIPQKILVAGGGIGRGHVSTDFGAALFARDLVSPNKPTALLKGSGIDGIYDSDPNLNPNAVLLRHTDYLRARIDGLKVIDLSAWPILEDGGITTIIYKDAPGNMRAALAGQIGSRIDNVATRITG